MYTCNPNDPCFDYEILYFSWRFPTRFVACQSQDGAHANVMAELAAAPYVKAMKKDSTD